MELAYRTTTGKVRSQNEDTVFLIGDETKGIALVADGMGGHAAGEKASQIVYDIFSGHYEEMPTRPDTMSDWVRMHIEQANREILGYAKREGLAVVGTTIACACWAGDILLIAHVGDSRVYAIAGGKLKQLTVDHSYVNMLKEMGELSEEEVRHHPRRNLITRSVGSSETVEVDVQVREAPDYDVLLVCSDGLTDQVTDERIEELLGADEPLERIVDHLVKEAEEQGTDNITVAAVRFLDRKKG